VRDCGKEKVDRERNRDPIKGSRSRGGGDEDELRSGASNDDEL